MRCHSLIDTSYGMHKNQQGRNNAGRHNDTPPEMAPAPISLCQLSDIIREITVAISGIIEIVTPSLKHLALFESLPRSVWGVKWVFIGHFQLTGNYFPLTGIQADFPFKGTRIPVNGNWFGINVNGKSAYFPLTENHFPLTGIKTDFPLTGNPNNSR